MKTVHFKCATRHQLSLNKTLMFPINIEYKLERKFSFFLQLNSKTYFTLNYLHHNYHISSSAGLQKMQLKPGIDQSGQICLSCCCRRRRRFSYYWRLFKLQHFKDEKRLVLNQCIFSCVSWDTALVLLLLFYMCMCVHTNIYCMCVQSVCICIYVFICTIGGNIY